jgi:phosphodiesterase/alkaline phosphatase D-like protein
VVWKLTRNPLTEKYELASELVSNGFVHPSDVAVDLKGDIFVAGRTSGRVVEFGPSGTQLASIDTSAALSGGNANEVAVDAAGDLFIRSGVGLYKYPANGAGEIDPASFVQIVPPRKGAGGIAIDTVRNLLYAMEEDGHISVYDAASNEADPQPELEFGEGVFEKVEDNGSETSYFYARIAINSAAKRIYVSGASPKKVLAFGYGPKLPTVKLGAASPVNASKETLAATVNPDGEAVTGCVFEYGATTAYGQSKPCEGALPADEANHAVSAALTGLSAGTEYHYRVSATNANGANKSVDKTFTTLAGERARTDAATGVARTKATLNGTAFPEGKALSECRFEYGTTESYGSTAPCSPQAASIPADETGHAVSAALVELQPTTTYHFRIATEGELGPAQGEDKTFTTGEIAITGAPTSIGGNKATVTGAVFPEGKAISECLFEYGPTNAYGKTASCGAVPTDEAEHKVSATLTHLVPNGAAYHYRITTVGGYGTAHGADKTLATAETVITGAASEISGQAMTVNGTINPEEVPLTACLFEYGTTESYGQSAPCESPAAAQVTGGSPVAVHAHLAGLEGAATYHYRLAATTADGTAKGKDKTAATSSPPTIREEWAQSVLTTEAQLEAKISPEGFPTTYRLEYGTTESYGQSTPEAEVGSNAQPHTVSDLLEGLQPGTVYHYRFVAESQLGTAEGEDHVFHTYSPSAPESDCPNQQYRSGSSANLPDCRAYEMVSPVDKEGGEIRVLGDFTTLLPGVLSQSSTDGEKLAYGSYRAFAGAESAPYTSQYIATREDSEGVEPGWRSVPISPPETTLPTSTVSFVAQFRAFSPDLCEGWLALFGEPTLAPDAVPGLQNIYRRQNCAEPPAYEALTNVVPLNVSLPNDGETELQGLSADRQTAIYTTPGQLTSKAPSTVLEGRNLLYETGPQGLRYICILPDGSPSEGGCTAGGPSGAGLQTAIRIDGALSTDGKRVFWSGRHNPIELSKLYLRENPFGEGAECSTAQSPCTIAVSEAAELETGGHFSQYWGASPDGSTALFSVSEALYEFSVQGEATRKIAGEVHGVAGTSRDASRVYFVSLEDLDGAGPARAGEPNLYLRDGGQGAQNIRLVARLTGEAKLSSLGWLAAGTPSYRASRTTPDGGHLAFISGSRPTGYDNADRNSGQADPEVYLYDAEADKGAGKLICVSCNPSGARPLGGEFKLLGEVGGGQLTAALIPRTFTNLHEVQVLSDGGRRLFFEAYDSLSLSDTNGARDVYQWEAPGEGRCTTSSPTYSPFNQGCVDLISSGKSPSDSEFTEADPAGKNVFFTTLASLVPWDPGVLDVYDARVEGGLPAPRTPAASCEGEACQSAPEAPNDPTPASSAFEGAGNVREETPVAKRPCAKGKVKRHGRCVTRKHARKRRANRNRRTGR